MPDVNVNAARDVMEKHKLSLHQIRNRFQMFNAATVRLEEQRLSGEWEADAEIVAAGEDPTTVAAILSAGGRVLVVDAVDMGKEPGAWRLLRGEEVLGCTESSRTSTHSLPLASIVKLARALGCEENLRVLGIQAGSMSPYSGLSPGVLACLPLVVRQIRKEAEVLS